MVISVKDAKSLIFVLVSIVTTMGIVLEELRTIRAIAMLTLWEKTVKRSIIAIIRTVLIMEHVKIKIPLTNAIVIVDTLAKTVNMIIALTKHVQIVVPVIVENTPTHVTATLDTWGTIANVLTAIQTNVKIMLRV